jgi:Flp pilus assembly pilin Flp
MIWTTVRRFIREDDGMEMVEWAIVGIVFAVAAATFWGDLGQRIDNALGAIENTVDPGGGGS